MRCTVWVATFTNVMSRVTVMLSAETLAPTL